MASPQTAGWWSNFLNTHGSDSEEESAFLGYLSTNHVDPGADSADLEAAYAAFVTYMGESAGRQADLGPTRAELASQQAVAEVEKQFVAKSKMSMPGPGGEKPMDAATRPAETKEEAPPESAPKAETASQAPSEASASESASGSRVGRRGSES